VDGNRFFVRTIALAGNSITQAIADELKQDFSHAEGLKLQILGGQSELPESSPARVSVVNAAHSFAGRLHLEITRSTVNYRRQSGAEQPAIVFVTGGGSLVPDLVATLAEKLKMQVERFDAVRNVEVSPSAAHAAEFSAVLADMVGLATRLVDKDEPSFTLLPPSIGEALAFAKQKPFYIGAAALLVVALALPVVSFNQRDSAAKQQARQLESQLAPLRALKAENAANLDRIETIQKEIAAIQGLVESKSNWINFFTDLQERLVQVEDVWLEKLQVLRPGPNDAAPASGGGLFGSKPAADGVSTPAAPVLRLNLSGRLLDRANPVSRVSQESFIRVKSLLSSFADSQFIDSVERETFNPNQPGILSFDFILVVDPKKPL
jgi:type IV pilus assembly protein PilM